MSWKRKANQPSRLKDLPLESPTDTELAHQSSNSPPPADNTKSNSDDMEFAPFLPKAASRTGCILNLSPTSITTSTTAGATAPSPKTQRETASADIISILRDACLSSSLSREEKISLLSEVANQISGLKRQLNSSPLNSSTNSNGSKVCGSTEEIIYSYDNIEYWMLGILLLWHSVFRIAHYQKLPVSDFSYFANKLRVLVDLVTCGLANTHKSVPLRVYRSLPPSLSVRWDVQSKSHKMVIHYAHLNHNLGLHINLNWVIVSARLKPNVTTTFSNPTLLCFCGQTVQS